MIIPGSAVCAMLRDGGDATISLDDIEATSLATFRIVESLRTGRVCYIRPPEDPHHSLKTQSQSNGREDQ